MSDFLTTREMAALLRVKPRKIYDMAAEGALPVRKLTGKLLFPRVEIENWLKLRANDALAPSPAAALQPSAPPLIAAGGHDPLLEWALRESQSGIAGFFDGALDGLARAEHSACALAGLHLPDGEGWNLGPVIEKFATKPWVLVEWAKRRRGLICRPGLARPPQRLSEVRGLRFQSRQPDAGSELVLDRLLRAEKMSRADLYAVPSVERSEFDLAGALAAERADVGLGLESAARQFNLDFAPLVVERFDLLIYRKFYFDPPMQALWALARSRRFAEKAKELGGYDISELGRARFNGAM